jgi:hypothetical protein
MTDMEVVLKSAGQSHLLDGITDEQREALFKQVQPRLSSTQT